MSTLDVQNLNLNRLNVATLNVTGTIIGSAAGLNITGNNTFGNVVTAAMEVSRINVTSDMTTSGNIYRGEVNVLYSPETTVSGTTYTFTSGDVGKMVCFTNSGNCVATIANNATISKGLIVTTWR